MIGVLANQKGGVGKTTNTLHLGAYLSKLGYKVLLIDFDSQCDLSHNIGLRSDSKKYNVFDLLGKSNDFSPIEKAPNLYIVAGDYNFASYKYKLNSLKNSLYKNRDGFVVADYFDFIFIDCPPSNIVLRNSNYSETELALFASDFFLIPLKADDFSIKNANTFLGKAFDFINTNKINVEFLGFFFGTILVTENSYSYYQAMLKDVAGDALFNSFIRQDSEVKKAVRLGKTIFQHKPNCRASKDYIDFANEFVSKLK